MTPRTATRLGGVAVLAGVALAVTRAATRRVGAYPASPVPPAEGSPPAADGPAGRRALRLTVAERTEVADGVVQIRLTGGFGSQLPEWQAGAHIDLVLPSGLVRQYSLCGEAAEIDSYTFATRRADDGGGGSREVHERLREGTEVEVRGPRNRFALVEADSYVFIAGGIGITPVLPMLRAAEAAGVPWRLVYGGRTRASMPFLEEVEKLGGGERVTIVPQDESGHPDLAAALDGAPEGTAVYCCGPEPMLEAVSTLCAERRLDDQLHMERFAPSANRRPTDGGDAVSGDGENRPFEVELGRTGTSLTVPAGSTALAAIRERYPNTPYSCEQGYCGTCLTGVVAGEIDHRDELLTEGERGDSMLICVSRALGDRLTLDL